MASSSIRGRVRVGVETMSGSAHRFTPIPTFPLRGGRRERRAGFDVGQEKDSSDNNCKSKAAA
jgi:hypothetical protein